MVLVSSMLNLKMKTILFVVVFSRSCRIGQSVFAFKNRSEEKRFDENYRSSRSRQRFSHYIFRMANVFSFCSVDRIRSITSFVASMCSTRYDQRTTNSQFLYRKRTRKRILFSTFHRRCVVRNGQSNGHGTFGSIEDLHASDGKKKIAQHSDVKNRTKTKKNKTNVVFLHFRTLYGEGGGGARGIRSFWRGNGIAVFKMTPEMALRQGIFETLRELRGDFDEIVRKSLFFVDFSIVWI